MSISESDFNDFEFSKEIAGEHNQSVNKSIDLRVRFHNGDHDVSYIVRSNKPKEVHIEVATLRKAIDSYVMI